MDVNSFMKVFTLIDITETKATKHRTDEKLLLNQQANFNTLFNTLSFRFNPEWNQSPTVEVMSEAKLKKKGFGNKYKGEHKVWTWEFDIDRIVPGSFLISLMEKDLDLIPVISGLNESISINNNVFRTTDKGSKNLIFEASE